MVHHENWEKLGPESRSAHNRRVETGFYEKYLQGRGIDVGYRGLRSKDVLPITPGAIGVDLDYPGFDGLHLPFEDNSLDFVYSSHMLEHVVPEMAASTISDWYRVTKVNGYIVTAVPHFALYEKRAELPSKWNADHKIMFSPSTMIQLFSMALPINSYRIRHFQDCDTGYTYDIGPEQHAGGEYQIELVLQKITPPKWNILDACL